MRILTTISGILLSFALCSCGAGTCGRYASPQTQVITERYAVNILRGSGTETPEPSCIEIRKEGVPVFSKEGFYFHIGSIAQGDTETLESTDITGDGRADLVISEYTGGAHCCLLLHIFKLEPKFRYIQSINAKHSNVYFQNLDADPALELVMQDWTFAYWNTAFAESPAPEVILKYNGGNYAVSPELMWTPPPGTKELDEIAAGIESSPDWHDTPKKVPVTLWAEMLDLIYTGNMSQAWILFEISWPKEVSGKQEFLNAFKAQLESSPFWKDIRILNRGG